MRHVRDFLKARLAAVVNVLRVIRVLPYGGWSVLAGMGAIALVSAAMPALMALVTRSVLAALEQALAPKGHYPRAEAHLTRAVAAMIGLFVVMRCLRALSGPLSGLYTWRVQARLRQIARELAALPAGVSHLESTEIQRGLYMMGALGPYATYTAAGAATALLGLAQLYAGTFGALALLAGFSLWMPVGLGLVSVGLRVRFAQAGRRLQPAAAQGSIDLQRADYQARLVSSPASAQEVRLFGITEWLAGGFRSGWVRGKGHLWREQAAAARLSRVMYLAVGAVAVAVLGTLVRASVRGEISLPELGMYVAAVGSVLPLLSPSPESMALQYGIADREEGRRTAARIEEAALVARQRPPVLVPPRNCDLVFESVSFSYPSSDRLVLRDLDLVIPAGRATAIVGANGAGKTTIINLLTKMYRPSEGRILAGGVDLERVEAEHWRSNLAVVFQDFARYPLSLAENVAIAAGRSRWDYADVQGALEEVGLGRLADGLPRGLDTVLSRDAERGVELSGGQWQRVAIARALLALTKGAEILVLDEPTANLDVRAELALFKQVLGRCAETAPVVLVSHRFSTVRQAEHIVVVGRGRIIEEGSHDELVATAGRYARMFNLQARRFRDAVGDNDDALAAQEPQQ